MMKHKCVFHSFQFNKFQYLLLQNLFDFIRFINRWQNLNGFQLNRHQHFRNRSLIYVQTFIHTLSFGKSVLFTWTELISASVFEILFFLHKNPLQNLWQIKSWLFPGLCATNIPSSTTRNAWIFYYGPN